MEQQRKKLKVKNQSIYTKVSNDQRKTLLNLVNDQNMLLKDAADQLKLNYSTAKTILRIWKVEKRICRKYSQDYKTRKQKPKIFKIFGDKRRNKNLSIQNCDNFYCEESKSLRENFENYFQITKVEDILIKNHSNLPKNKDLPKSSNICSNSKDCTSTFSINVNKNNLKENAVDEFKPFLNYVNNLQISNLYLEIHILREHLQKLTQDIMADNEISRILTLYLNYINEFMKDQPNFKENKN